MHVHNLSNYLKSLGPTEAELQASLKAEQKRQDIKLDNEATEKIKKFKDQVASASEKQNNKPGSRGWTGPDKNATPPAETNEAEKPPVENLPPGTGKGRIDFKV